MSNRIPDLISPRLVHKRRGPERLPVPRYSRKIIVSTGTLALAFVTQVEEICNFAHSSDHGGLACCETGTAE